MLWGCVAGRSAVPRSRALAAARCGTIWESLAWDEGMPATVEARSRRYRVAAIVPSTAGAGPQGPIRWFADPYRPRLLYVLANDGVHRSDGGGARWVLDSSLT